METLALAAGATAVTGTSLWKPDHKEMFSVAMVATGAMGAIHMESGL